MQKAATPRVEDSVTDRGLKALDSAVSRLVASPMSNGVVVTVKPTADGTLRVPHRLGRKANGAILLGSDRGIFGLCLRSSDSKAATFAVSRQWEMLERTDVNSTSQTHDFDAKVNGTLDSEYMVEGLWMSPAGSASTLRMRINAATASTNNGYAYYGGTTVTAGTASNIAYARKLSTSAEEIHFRTTFLAEKGAHRFALSTCSHTDGTAAANTEGTSLASKWEDTATEIVSLGVRSQLANYVLAGSHFTLYRRPRLNGRTLTLWIF